MVGSRGMRLERSTVRSFSCWNSSWLLCDILGSDSLGISLSIDENLMPGESKFLLMEGRGSVDSPADGEERGLNSGISNSLSEAIEEEQTEMASICRALSGDGALTLMIGLSASLVGLSCGFVELGSGGEGELDEDVL